MAALSNGAARTNAARGSNIRGPLRRLKIMGVLNAQDIHGTGIVADKRAADRYPRRAGLGVVDRSIADEQMGIPEIDHSRPGHLVAGTDGQPLAVVVWNPRRTVLIFDRTLIVGNPAAQLPTVAVLIGDTG